MSDVPAAHQMTEDTQPSVSDDPHALTPYVLVIDWPFIINGT